MSQSFELEGKIKLINEIQSFDSGFTKREFVVEVEDGKYPQMIKFECVREKTALTDGLAIEDPVKVTFDIRGNEFKERYYVNLNAWKMEKLGAGSGGGSAPPEYDDMPPSDLSEPPGGHGEEDEPPF